MKKIFKLMMVITCMAAVCMMAGCGKKPAADSAEAAVTGLLDASKTLDFEKMESYTSNADWDVQIKDMLTIDAWNNFISVTAGKMTYEITDVKEDGNQTIVTAKINYVDGSDAYNDAMNEYFSAALSMVAQDTENIDEDAIIGVLDDILKEKVETVDETMTETTIAFISEKKDGWRISNVGEEFQAMLTANLTAIADQLGSDVELDLGDSTESEAPAETAAE